MLKRETIANGIGLSVLAAGLIVGLSVVSHLKCPNCFPVTDIALRWCGLAVVFLACYSVLSLAAIYLWRRYSLVRTPAHWLGFIALCGVLIWTDPIGWRGWIRGSGVVGIIVGIVGLVRSL